MTSIVIFIVTKPSYSYNEKKTHDPLSPKFGDNGGSAITGGNSGLVLLLNLEFPFDIINGCMIFNIALFWV